MAALVFTLDASLRDPASRDRPARTGEPALAARRVCSIGREAGLGHGPRSLNRNTFDDWSRPRRRQFLVRSLYRVSGLRGIDHQTAVEYRPGLVVEDELGGIQRGLELLGAGWPRRSPR